MWNQIIDKQKSLVGKYATKVEKTFRTTSKNIVKYQTGQAKKLASEMQVPFWIAERMLKNATANFLQ